MSAEGLRAAKLDALAPADTSWLADYEGAYYSDEIDVVYRVSQRDGRLVITRRKFNPIQPSPPAPLTVFNSRVFPERASLMPVFPSELRLFSS